MNVLTLGTFDLFHEGHSRLLERAAGYGRLTVGVNSERFVILYKGLPPVHSTAQRAENVTPYAHHVLVNDGPGIDLIRALRPGLIAIGSDWLDNDYTAQLGTSAKELADLDVAVLFLPRTPGVSTSELRAA